MKSVTFFLFFTFLMNLSVNAQNCDCRLTRTGNKIALLGGLSIVDDGFTEDYNPFKVQERWQFGYFAGIEYFFSNKISFQLVYSSNVYKAGKTINGGNLLRRDIDYNSLNLHAVYSLGHLFDLNSLQPYAIGGAGETTINKNSRFTLNLGMGLRVWFGDVFYKRKGFHENIALDIRSLGHFNLPIGQEKGRQLQHTVGLLYRF